MWEIKVINAKEIYCQQHNSSFGELQKTNNPTLIDITRHKEWIKPIYS